MKPILYLIFIGSFALTLTALGNEDHRDGKKARQAQAVATQNTSGGTVNRARSFNTQRSFSAPRVYSRGNDVARFNNSNTVVRRNNFNNARLHTSQEFNSNAVVRRNNLNNARLHASQEFNSNAVVRRNNLNNARLHASQDFNSNAVARRNNLNNGRFQGSQDFSARRARLQNRNDVAVNGENNFNRARNINRNQNFRSNRDRNVTVRNNWQDENFRGEHYSAFRNYRREWHDRGWWNHHCDRVIFISGGWWAWNAGYWYPAWGYDPYCSYSYDGPIYGYSDLAPDQIIVNVQLQLQREGYYVGPIDGVLGPMTRQGIAAFQADHGLAVTAAVDEPTLATLGLV
jgi:hypothetical protein